MIRSSDVRAVLGRLGARSDVTDAVEAARAACAPIRWHPALRRRAEAARAEATVRAACCSAALAGSRFPLDLIRDAARGASALPDDAAGRTATGALRAVAAAERMESTFARSVVRAPAQALARLHMAASAGLLPGEALGRPRQAGEAALDGSAVGLPPPPDGPELAARLAGVADLLTVPDEVPALLVAALVHAELATVRPFVAGNDIVARAAARVVLVGRGLDPTGTVIWEAGHLAAGAGYPSALAGYAGGAVDGIGAWLQHCAEAVLSGATEAKAICDAVLAGRLS